MQNKLIEAIEQKNLRKEIPQFQAGDTVRVHWKIKEGDKERTQPFEGVVIRKTEKGVRGSFTVRKVSYGVGVERVFPMHSTRWEQIEVVSEGRVRRANLYYLRNLQGRAARVSTKEEGTAEGNVSAAPAAPAAK